MIRSLRMATLALPLLVATGCGYHALGPAAHLPAAVRVVAVPVFQTRTEAYRTELRMTNAVIRELSERTQLRVTPREDGDPDAVLQGVILKETATPLTYNSGTQQSSSYLITILAEVTLTGRDGKVLYHNANYVFREQYQSTTSLPFFFQENPAAIERLSRQFARQLVADLLESF